jgi:hypothetical protein
MANMPASVQTLLISAPVELGHSRASSSYRISCTIEEAQCSNFSELTASLVDTELGLPGDQPINFSVLSLLQ